MNNCITGQAAYYKADGHWNISLVAPEWVISDIKKELAAKGGVITVGSYGGATMLLVAASWDVRHPAPPGLPWLGVPRSPGCQHARRAPPQARLIPVTQ